MRQGMNCCSDGRSVHTTSLVAGTPSSNRRPGGHMRTKARNEATVLLWRGFCFGARMAIKPGTLFVGVQPPLHVHLPIHDGIPTNTALSSPMTFRVSRRVMMTTRR